MYNWLSLSRLVKSSTINVCNNSYQIVESVDRKEGIVSIVVITALRTMANDTQTLSAKAAWLDDGSSRSRKSFRLKGFCFRNKREHMDKNEMEKDKLIIFVNVSPSSCRHMF